MKRATTILIALILCFLVANLARGGKATSAPVGQKSELARKQLEDGSVLRLEFEDITNPSDLAALYGGTEHQKLSHVFHYHAELLPAANSQPLTLWTLTDPVSKDTPTVSPFRCLDLACGNSTFIVVLESVGQLWLYYQDCRELTSNTGATSGWMNLSSGEWCMYAASGPIDPKELKAEISLNPDSDWEIRVIHRNDHDGRTTLYRKLKDKWEFGMVSSNRDKE